MRHTPKMRCKINEAEQLKACDSLRGEGVGSYNILIAFDIPMKLVI
jgi:hypothetical protein